MTELQLNFLDTLEKSLGITSVALKTLEIERETYEGWLNNLEFKKRITQINEGSIDFVENKLLQKINQNDLNAIQFYLKTKGKKRGY